MSDPATDLSQRIVFKRKKTASKEDKDQVSGDHCSQSQGKVIKNKLKKPMMLIHLDEEEEN